MPTTSVEIVKLPVSAWRDYKALRLEALQTEPQAFSTTYASSLAQPDSFWQARLEAAAQGQTSWLLFAKEGPALLGMIGAFIDESNPATADIISVYVTRPARGRGISRLLMSAILAEVKKVGVKKARLGVNPQQTAAMHLYQNFGFKFVGREEHALMGNGEYADEYLMEKFFII
jgi:ribosomal protein S18 acetylase RimI-like enzyme